MINYRIHIDPPIAATINRLNQLPRRVYYTAVREMTYYGEILQDTIRRLMSNTVRAPWFYRSNGKLKQPSAPLFPPAIQEGVLYDAIHPAMQAMYPQAELQVGTMNSPEAYYARYLEYGAPGHNLIKRPFAAPAFYHTIREFETRLQRAFAIAVRGPGV